MIEPDLDGRGVPSASRRWLIKLGGGLAGLLLVPNLALAATRKVAKAAGASSKKAASGSASRAKAAGAKATGRAAKGSSGKSTMAASRGRSGKAGVKTAKVQKGGSRLAKRSAADRVVDPAGLDLDQAPAIISPRGSAPGCRALALYNVHTDEAVHVEYYIDGRYEPEGMREIDRVLRDYHTDEICPIDPDVLNQLFDVRAALGSMGTYKVYSGYRSPETNEAYRRMGARVAEHSFHVKGKAIDVSLPGRDLRQLRAVALAMQTGGVGYYPWDGFVHIDSGPVRKW